MNSTMKVIFGLLGGLAVFIFGMNMMSDCLQKAAGERMKSILALLTKNPILGVIAGALTTAVLQSSSATTVMAIGFVSAGLMNLPQAISIILGANIGTTMTAQIIAFKLSDYIYIIIFIGFIISFIVKSEKAKNIGQTIFAFGLLFLGIETMGSVMKIIPDGKKTVYSNSEAMYLDSKLVGQPTAALQLVVKEIVRCTELVGANLKELISVLEKNDSEKVSEVIKNAEDTRSLYDRITEYLAELFASGGLTEEQATQTAGIMYVLSDVDRMGALCREIGLSLKDKEEKKYKYSEKAMDDLKTSLQLILKMYSQAADMMITGNVESAKKILKQKEQIMDLGIKMRKSHVQRVGKGKCIAKLTEPFNKIIHSVDRMGNCCINMVDAVQGQIGLRYFLEYSDHSYIVL